MKKIFLLILILSLSANAAEYADSAEYRNENVNIRQLVVVLPKQIDKINTQNNNQIQNLDLQQFATQDGATTIHILGASGAIKADLSKNAINKLEATGKYEVFEETRGLSPN